MSSSPSPQNIVVVGGGIIGTCSAYYLATSTTLPKGSKVTIVEGSEIAAGASGKAGGLLALDWHGPSTSSLAALSYRLHHDLASTHNGTAWGFRQLDTLSVQADLSKSSPPNSSTTAKKAAESFAWLDANVLTGTSVLGSKESTAQVHPGLFTKAMAELTRDEGVEVVFGTAEALRRSEDGSFGLEVVARDGGETKTLEGVTSLVLAAGPWTGGLAKKLGVKAGRAKGITGSRAHSVVLRTAEKRMLPAQALFTSIKEKKGRGWSEPEIYNRPDGTAYACGPTDTSPLPALASDVKVDAAACASIIAQVAALSPDYLAVGEGEFGAMVEAQQACYLPVGSAGGDPVIGEVEKGVWVASGHSCWGITMGPGTGKVVAELVLEGKATSASIKALAP
ncbi:hypothetical protein MNV49_007299 [Pseudohyphozyma bogoriensis]|nr:hypothetical protein MNV49_007299 [Pseudohyphozyma bogoriensis]